MKDLKLQIIISIVIVVSLIIGGLSGVLGSLYLVPKLNNLIPDNRVVEQTIHIEENSATIDVVKKATPSVVSIVISKELSSVLNPFGFFSQPRTPGQKQRIGGGTGFIISSDGLILTNKHVVSDEQAEYTVVLNDESSYPAQVLGRDFNNDIAVLKIEATDLPVIELGDSEQIEIGEPVIAIGYTLGEYANTVTKGVISGVRRSVFAGNNEVLEGAIQTDAAINPGNSGGPLLNLSGQVIAINTAVNRDGEAIGFSIPINIAKRVVDSINQYGKIVRPWLGVRYLEINETIAKMNNLTVNYGAIIVRGQQPGSLAIVPGSPADKAGLEENDIILEINNQKIEGKSLAHELQKYNPGDEISLKILHDGEEKIVTAILAERTEQ